MAAPRTGEWVRERMRSWQDPFRQREDGYESERFPDPDAS
jgi:hypothetical protein